MLKMLLLVILIIIIIIMITVMKIVMLIIMIIRRPGRAHGCAAQGYRPLSIHLPWLQMQIQTSEFSPSKAPDANAPFLNC